MEPVRDVFECNLAEAAQVRSVGRYLQSEQPAGSAGYVLLAQRGRPVRSPAAASTFSGTSQWNSRKMSDEEFSKGDKVTWKSHGSTVEGSVENKITADTGSAGRTVRASKDEPQYHVRSEKTGADAVHKPSALRRQK